MPRGGKRPGAGRPRGSTVKKRSNAFIEKVIAETPEATPLAYMLAIMKDPNVDERRRDAMAIAAAPFVHPKLATINANVGGSVRSITSVNIVSMPTGLFSRPNRGPQSE